MKAKVNFVGKAKLKGTLHALIAPALLPQRYSGQLADDEIPSPNLPTVTKITPAEDVSALDSRSPLSNVIGTAVEVVRATGETAPAADPIKLAARGLPRTTTVISRYKIRIAIMSIIFFVIAALGTIKFDDISLSL